MGKLGADVDQLDQLAVNLDRAATRLEDNASIIDGQTRALWWSGSTADRFAASWTSVDRRHLNTIAASMREAAKRVRFDAQQQRLASNSGGSISTLEGRSTSSLRVDGAGDDGLLEMLLESALGVVAAFGTKGLDKLLGPLGRVLAVLSIGLATHDLFFERRTDGLGWIESIADVFAIGGGVALLIGMAFPPAAVIAVPVGLALMAVGIYIDVGLAIHDNFDGLKDAAADVRDKVVGGIENMVAPVVDVAEGVVDVTSNIVDAVGDSVEAIGDAAHAVGSIVTAPGRLIGALI